MNSIKWLEKELKSRYSLLNSEPLFEQAKEMNKAEQENKFTEEQVREAICISLEQKYKLYHEQMTEDEILLKIKQIKNEKS